MKERKNDVRKAKQFLTSEKDILNNLDSDTDEDIPPTPQKLLKRKPLRTSASAPRLIQDPLPQKITTPRRRKRSGQ